MILWKLDKAGVLIKAENMSDEEALAQGYKPLEWTPMPDDGRYYSSSWVEGEEAIVRTWEETTLPEPTTDELIEIILGGTP